MEHFGIVLKKRKYDFYLKREEYALINDRNSLKFQKKLVSAYADKEGKKYTKEWCERHREKCLKNFDINMQYFLSLNWNKFNSALEKFLERNKEFIKIDDLNKFDKKSGYYMMVLDKYCQIYIGTTENIKKRIQQHWSQSKPFDRLIFPMNDVENSILSIDSFRALDTTRIYVLTTNDLYDKEDKYISDFPQEFVLNRMRGGKIKFGYIEACSKMRKRNISKMNLSK